MTAARTPEAAERTRWGYVALLIAGGVCAAMQIGKVPPALPTLQRDLNFGIVAAGWVISMFSIIGAVLGCLAGSVADRLGARRVTVCGLLLMAAASFAGSAARNAGQLLVSRAVEGMAFVIVVVAIPSLLAASAAARHRRVVPSMWGTYMPIGMAIAMTIAPIVVLAADWRVLWNMNAALLIAAALALIAVPPPQVAHEARGALTWSVLKRTLEERGSVLLAVMFIAYAFQYLSVLGFLPTILEEQGVGSRTAGLLAAIAVIVNAVGNLSASALFARHVQPWRLVALASVGMCAATICIYSEALPPMARYVMTVAFSAIGGFVPASIFATVPIIARRAGTGATTMGVTVQASNIGQLIGPPIVAAVAARAGGWQLSPLVLVPAALLVLAAALGLRRMAPS